MPEDGNGVLVLPRHIFAGVESFTPWHRVESLLEGQPITWLPRPEAERSSDWVQPIPCALICDVKLRYCAFRRVGRTRPDLRRRVSMVIGGHVEHDANARSIRTLLIATLLRELSEEVSVHKPRLTPIGLVIDWASFKSSRHVGFVYEAAVGEPVRVQATEEFSKASRITGRFFPVDALAEFGKRLDPWSQVLYQTIMR